MTTTPSSTTDDNYHVIVIGSGAAGLTCALRLATSGLRVLLLEKNEWVGGYSHGFGQDGFYWDHGGHIFLAYRLGAQAREVFQRLKIDEHVEMVPDQHDYRCIFPDESIAIPAEMSVAGEIFAERFPEERDGIAKVLLTMESLVSDADQFVPAFRVDGGVGERKLVDPVLEQFQRSTVSKLAGKLLGSERVPAPNLLKYQTKTLQELLDEHLKDPYLKGYFSMLSAGIGIGPARLSAVIAGVFFIHALRTQWMPKGGFGKLADALATLIEERGGTIKLGAEVSRILFDGEKVTGVETVDGHRYAAHAVVSASDARRTFLEMLPPESVPEGLRERLPKMDLSPSIFQVHLGVDMDLEPYRDDLKRLNFMYPYPDIDRAMANFPDGNIDEAAFFLYVATFHQPEMAPPGLHSLKLEAYTTLDARGIDWERDKQRLGDVLIKRSEALIPGLGNHIVTRAHRTPADLMRDTGNSEGAFAGWAFTPELLSRERPQQRTPVPGLYLAGHWTTPSAGVPWVMLSGFNTAGMLMRDLKKKRAASGSR